MEEEEGGKEDVFDARRCRWTEKKMVVTNAFAARRAENTCLCGGAAARAALMTAYDAHDGRRMVW